MLRCSSCLNASTRPRIEFDSAGRCNACQWMEEKKTLDWNERQTLLDELLARHKGKGQYDCIVTVSGGKDGSYVADNLRNKYGMNPLCLTIRPPMELDIGVRNLSNFLSCGFDHIHLTPNVETMRTLDRIGFEEFGQGYYGWLIAIFSSVMRTAQNFGINLVFYSEDGEIEYGGSTAHKNTPVFGADYMEKVYLSDQYKKVMEIANLSDRERYWFEFPKSVDTSTIEVAHYSFYEAWDPYRNYLYAKQHCGLIELDTGTVGTFTNFAQNDQALATLHYYLMYLKLGFGRATQDAGIEIRRGAMTREQAVNLVSVYDNQPPIDLFPKYAEYFKMSIEEFEAVIDKFANKELFEKVDGIWQPLFEVT